MKIYNKLVVDKQHEIIRTKDKILIEITSKDVDIDK